MFQNLKAVLFLFFGLSEFEIFAYPIEILETSSNFLPFQLFNTTNLLAHQSYNLYGNLKTNDRRNKRSISELFDLFNLDDYDDMSSKNESSAEEQEKIDPGKIFMSVFLNLFNLYDDENTSKEEESLEKAEHDLCLNCTVNFNRINQVQHIYHDIRKEGQENIKNISETIKTVEQIPKAVPEGEPVPSKPKVSNLEPVETTPEIVKEQNAPAKPAAEKSNDSNVKAEMNPEVAKEETTPVEPVAEKPNAVAEPTVEEVAKPIAEIPAEIAESVAESPFEPAAAANKTPGADSLEPAEPVES